MLVFKSHSINCFDFLMVFTNDDGDDGGGGDGGDGEIGDETSGR